MSAEAGSRGEDVSEMERDRERVRERVILSLCNILHKYSSLLHTQCVCAINFLSHYD